MSIAIRLPHLLVGSLVGIVFFLGTDSVGAQPSELHLFQSLTYEYQCRRPACDGPLFVLIPGFNQHNRSAEFVILKSFLRARGFGYLIINPRQHGEVFTWSPVFSWGEDEVAEMTALLESLHVVQHHEALHLLGFSIGGKAALRLAARAPLRDQITSVVAVAAPWRLGDINYWLSGQFDKPLESVLSGVHANKRASPARLAYMALVGMSQALTVNTASPGREVRSIRAPTLLLHGLNDWLIRSSHSKRLFRQAAEHQPFGFVAIRTHTHAEDMLSRHTASVRNALLETVHAWVDFIKTASHPKTPPESA